MRSSQAPHDWDFGTLVSRPGHKLDGVGAQTDDIFRVTGCVIVTQLFAVIDTVTDDTTLDQCGFDADDGAADDDITSNGPGALDLSGIAEVGSVLLKDSGGMGDLGHLRADEPRVSDAQDGAKSPFRPFTLLANAGADTDIRFRFLGDGATDVDVTFFLRYIPLVPGSSVVLV